MAVMGRMRLRVGDRPNFVPGTGCDLPMETPLANLDALFDSV